MMKWIVATLLVAGAGMLLLSESAMAGTSCGKASWYAMNSKTASGERMNPSAMTAAHRNYRFGSKIRVTNKRNGKSVVVRINDRGPFVKGRIIDVSKAAASQLGFIRSGHAAVCIQQIS